MKNYILFFTVTIAFLSCTSKVKQPKKLIVQCGTRYSNGNYFEFFNDSTYVFNCFLFQKSEGLYSLINDTIFLDFKEEGDCKPEKKKYLIQYDRDSSYVDENNNSVTLSIPDKKGEGHMYQLDSNNKIMSEKYGGFTYVYDINVNYLDSIK
jgi:hypothetical protein